MTRARVTTRGRITIPIQVRNALGLGRGDRIEFVESAPGQFAIRAAGRSVRELKGLFRGKVRKSVSIEAMNEGIARAASKIVKP